MKSGYIDLPKEELDASDGGHIRVYTDSRQRSEDIFPMLGFYGVVTCGFYSRLFGRMLQKILLLGDPVG
ncbi:hypothetical protein NEOLI_005004, partial [Neolecta irregularis DAH-3]